MDKNLFLNIDSSFLFDLKSIIFGIFRLINEKFQIKEALSNKYLNALEFNNIDEFLEKFPLINEKHLLEEVKTELIELLFKFVGNYKPRIENMQFLSNLIKSLNNANYKTYFTIDFSNCFFADNYQFYSTITKNIENTILQSQFKPNYLTNFSFLKEDIPNYAIIHSASTFEEILESITAINEKFNTEALILNLADIQILDNELVGKYSDDLLKKQENFKFLGLWCNYSLLSNVFSVKGKVVSGFNRGSRSLGVPTCNIEINSDVQKGLLKESIIMGIYFSDFRFCSDNSGKNYRGVLSIGFNPYYDNNQKTIEVFVIDYFGEDFYDEIVEINIFGYLRSETTFSSFQDLVTAITYDIITVNNLFESKVLI